MDKVWWLGLAVERGKRVVVYGQSLVARSGCRKREERLVVVVCGQSLVTY